MTNVYRHTQFGTLLVTALVLGIAGSGAGMLLEIRAPSLGPVLAILLIGLVLFPTLTSEVREHQLKLFFGLGLIRRSIDLREVTAASVVQNPWYYGWGLRKIPGGWMWNVSGMRAVELVLRDGRRFRVGTDQPEELHRAITEARSAG